MLAVGRVGCVGTISVNFGTRGLHNILVFHASEIQDPLAAGAAMKWVVAASHVCKVCATNALGSL